MLDLREYMGGQSAYDVRHHWSFHLPTILNGFSKKEQTPINN